VADIKIEHKDSPRWMWIVLAVVGILLLIAIVALFFVNREPADDTVRPLPGEARVLPSAMEYGPHLNDGVRLTFATGIPLVTN
jgi:flagellar basal body-associated protein FliL